MTLDETIVEANRIAKLCAQTKPEHAEIANQLAEWLSELKERRLAELPQGSGAA